VDPLRVTHAYAKSAQIGGAEIVRHTRVTDLKARSDGSWDVIAITGMHAEYVVNAAGQAREWGAWSALNAHSGHGHQYDHRRHAELKGKKPSTASTRANCTLAKARRHAGTYENRGAVVPTETPWISARPARQRPGRIAPSLEVA
jgi:dimethylglycine dehydrogenase